VRTVSATLRDVGTAFTVRNDADGGTRVAVTSGAVDVTARAPGEPTMLLRAGDRAVVALGGRMSVDRGVASNEDLSWTRGVLRFQDAPLVEVAAGVRRWFGLELVVTDSALARRRLTASFDQGSADGVGAVLAAALGGSASRTGDTLRISPTAAR
jgi:transmembrane sensor